jgi:hypothetical protein
MLNRLKDVFKSFQKLEVKYVVVGEIAAILYGAPRATFDLDILIESSAENAQRLLDALLEAGLGTAFLTDVDKLLANEITVFNDKIRLDVQTSTPGLNFQEVWDRRVTMNYQGQDFFVISKEDLISFKQASSRDVDLEDIRLLELHDNDDEE